MSFLTGPGCWAYNQYQPCGKLRQEVYKLKACLENLVTSCLAIKKEKKGVGVEDVAQGRHLSSIHGVLDPVPRITYQLSKRSILIVR